MQGIQFDPRSMARVSEPQMTDLAGNALPSIIGWEVCTFDFKFGSIINTRLQSLDSPDTRPLALDPRF